MNRLCFSRCSIGFVFTFPSPFFSHWQHCLTRLIFLSIVLLQSYVSDSVFSYHPIVHVTRPHNGILVFSYVFFFFWIPLGRLLVRNVPLWVYSLEITVTRPVQRYEWGRREPRNNNRFLSPLLFRGLQRRVCVCVWRGRGCGRRRRSVWSGRRVVERSVNKSSGFIGSPFPARGRFWFPVGCSPPPPPPGRLASADWRRRRPPIDASHCCWPGPNDERTTTTTTTWWWPFVGSANARVTMSCARGGAHSWQTHTVRPQCVIRNVFFYWWNK